MTGRGVFMAVEGTNSVINNPVAPKGNPTTGFGVQGSSLRSNSSSQAVNNMFNAYYSKNNVVVSNPHTLIKREAAFLKVIAEDIMSFSKSPFRRKTIVSGDNDVVHVRTNGKTFSSGFRAEIKVHQTATHQKNMGNALSTNDIYKGDKGTHYFTISIGGKSFNASIEIVQGDTNKEVMENVISTINETKVGVFAEMKYDLTSKQSSLVLSSTKTGEISAFAISDVEGFGSIVSDLRIANVVEAAQNAIYSLNDSPDIVSFSNEVSLGSGIKAIFRNASDVPVKIFTGADVDIIRKQINEFVKSFNDLLKAAGSNKGDKISGRSAQKLRDAVNAYSPTLFRSGLEVQDGGYLKVNVDALNAAIANGTAERMFQPFGGIVNGGIASRISKIAGDAYRDANKAGAGPMSEFRKINPDEILNNYFNFINQQNTFSSKIGFGKGASGSLYDIML